MDHPLVPGPFRFPAYDDVLERRLCRASRDELSEIQSARLRHIVKYAYESVPFYRRRWSDVGLVPKDVRTIEDLAALPTWNVHEQRSDLEQNPPFGSYYVDDIADDIAIMLSTSGTTGIPRLAPVSFRDLPGLKDNFGRVYANYGLREGDLLQVTFTYATMGAAWACHWAAEAAGVGVIPASSGRTTSSERQVDLIRRAGVTALTGTASFLLHLANTAVDLGHDPSSWQVRIIVTAGELSSPSVRRQLEELWGAKVYDLFGSVDALTWACCDCEASREEAGRLGMHIWEDVCAVEVLDPDGRPVTPGEYGELCITSFSFRTSPRIRFRTGDLTAVRYEPCSCGRTLARMMPIAGRVDHTLRIHAQNIFPMALENAVLAADPTIREWYAEAVSVDGKDRLRVHVECRSTNDASYRLHLEAALSKGLNLGNIDVILHTQGKTADVTGAGSETKIKRIFDRRL